MAPRQPKREDFPSTVTLEIVPPPGNDTPTNVLILLHGLGDSQTPFSSLGRNLNLPETTCVALRGTAPMPFDIPGYHWGDDIVFDNSTGEMDADTGFEKAKKVLVDDVIQKTLIEKCGYTYRAIMLFGFGQGGILALHTAISMPEVGGVVSLGGALPNERAREVGRAKCRTPIIVCKGNSRSAVKDEDEDMLKESFEFVEIKEWNRPGDGMPKNHTEMLPIMQFFARRLRSTKGVPKGSIELV